MQIIVGFGCFKIFLKKEKRQNVACGGATTVNDRPNLVPGLLAQVQSFVQATPELPPTALYVLWAGANDYLQGTNQVTQPVNNIQTAIARLARQGAQRFLVANLPDLGHLPATRHRADAARLSQLTQQHNQGLRRSLKVLAQQLPDVQVVTLDSYGLYQAAIANPAEFGFSQVAIACVAGSGICEQPDRFLFWDDIHPTTRGHQFLADGAVAALELRSFSAQTHDDHHTSPVSSVSPVAGM